MGRGEPARAGARRARSRSELRPWRPSAGVDPYGYRAKQGREELTGGGRVGSRKRARGRSGASGGEEVEAAAVRRCGPGVGVNGIGADPDPDR